MERPLLKAPGTPVDQLDTPAVVIDLDDLAHNLETAHAPFRDGPVRLRPNAHAHKTPALAHLQLAVDGAAPGIAVATVGEAEVFAQAGIDDIRLTQPVVTARKAARLAALAHGTRISAVADSDECVHVLSEACTSAGVHLDVLVSVRTQPRGGGAAPEDAAALARAVDAAPGLVFGGVLSRGRPLNESSVDAAARLAATRRAIEEAGLPVEVASFGDSTHEYEQVGAVEGMTEVRAGGYGLLDARHAPHCPALRHAVRVLATVNGVPEPSRAITDCGQKAIGRDHGQPLCYGRNDLVAAANSAEHGMLDGAGGSALDLGIGDKVWLVPADAATLFTLHDVVYAARDGVVAEVWDVGARGAFA